MAKEMMIVFVYDTLACTAEEDDPADAVLYFHPGWVSDTQRHALAGQVVGAAHCVKSLFSQPTSISLQSGKFILREYGRYILAIGSDRNIPEWVLNSRATLLTSMIRVYHGDLEAAAALVPGRRRVADKFYQMFETYLPVLQYGCHIFQRVPILTPPKSATSVFLESTQILDHCLKFKGVLGGIILYNNKIIASQLPPGLTSYLTVVDPYRIKSPAEPAGCGEGGGALPLGAQLLRVFAGRRTCAALRRRARLVRRAAEDAETVLADCRKAQEAEREKQVSGNFQGGMKRDKSLLFTAVPEEDHNMISPPVQDNRIESEQRRKLPNIPDVVPFANKPRPRPNKLSLSLKTKSIDEDAIEEKVFTGQTSVCSTPMVEYKRLHGNVLSICQNPESQPGVTEPDVVKSSDSSTNAKMIEFEKRENRMVFEFNTIGEHYINKPEPLRKLASVIDFQDTFKRLSDRATAKFKLKRATISEATSPERSLKKSVSTHTINDPSFPVFRNDGYEISESLFKLYLEQHYASMKKDLSNEENMFNFNKKLLEQEKFEGFDSEFTRSPQRTPKKVQKELKANQSNKVNQSVDQSRRQSLSLPLKSLNESDTEGSSFKKKLSGVQLTPLMEKLSHLAFSDKSSGYGSRVMTPLELKEFTPAYDRQVAFAQDKCKSKKQESFEDDDVPTDQLADYSQRAEACGLFVCGLQSVALLALVDLDDMGPETTHQLWETSLNALGPIEQKCMEPFPASNESSDYSYLVLDPDWGTVKKGGPWASLDIAAMGLIHSEMFSEDPELSEIILRSDNSVVLGHRCGGCEVYYSEAGPRAGGLPAPQDALSAAAARAQSRLARDHALVLL